MTSGVVLLALATAVVLTSVAAAGPAASKQRVTIATQAKRATTVSPFVLTPLQAGPIERDSGTLTTAFGPGRDVVRDGLSISISDDLTTFKGQRGTLVLRYHSEWVDAGSGYSVAADTWKVVRGTGQYAGVSGGGRGGSVSLARGPWSSRAQGFLTVR